MDNTYKIIIAQASGTASEADLKDETLLREDLGMDSEQISKMRMRKHPLFYCS